MAIPKLNQAALDRVRQEFNPRPDAMKDLQLVQQATHEAAHIVVGKLLGERVIALSLDDTDGGATSYIRHVGRDDVACCRRSAIALAAGWAADHEFFCAGDNPQANKNTPDDFGVCSYALTIHGKKASQAAIHKEVERAYRDARRLVRKHRREIEAVAEKIAQLYKTVWALCPTPKS
jgi:hypothetical protein